MSDTPEAVRAIYIAGDLEEAEAVFRKTIAMDVLSLARSAVMENIWGRPHATTFRKRAQDLLDKAIDQFQTDMDALAARAKEYYRD